MERIKYINNIRNPYTDELNPNKKIEAEKIEQNDNQRAYLNKLIEQYKKVTNTTSIDLNSPEFIMDLNNWINRNKAIGNITFISFLEENGIFIDKSTCAEIGKGYRDSLVSLYETTIVTPYPEGMISRTDGKTIDSEFKIENGTPLIYKKTVIKPQDIDTFLIHNPYNIENLKHLADIHHNKAYTGIIFGIYGKKQDKDMDQKISKLIKLRALLEDDYIHEEYSYGDTYCHILATDTTKRKLKRKN